MTNIHSDQWVVDKCYGNMNNGSGNVLKHFVECYGSSDTENISAW
jgi:hypothetical protein